MQYLLVTLTSAVEVAITPMLYGIGYYEAAAQDGINGISMAGGAEIVFYGQGMSHTPANTHAIFTNAEMGGAFQARPPTPQDVAFSTHTDGGLLKYSTPTLMDLHQRTYEDFARFESITYDVGLYDFDDMTQQILQINCKKSQASKCKITINRAMTPILYNVLPQVIYNGSQMVFVIDPRSSQNRKSQLLPEFPFVEVRLNQYGVDFEGFIEEDTVLPPYSKSHVRGIMGAITPSSSVDINFRFRVGYALHQESSMLRCSYDNSTCYKAKATAVINSIDKASGYSTGSQLITVKGYGFTSSNITAIIDGVPCAVQSNDINQFTCITGPQPNPSNQTEYAGQHGIRRRYLNTTYQLTASNITSVTNQTEFIETLATDLEAPINIKDGNSGNIYQGYFKAPATASYRFYVACDDSCQIHFSNVNMDSTQKTLIYQSNWWTSFRNYFTTDGKKMTEWLNLTKDEYYYLEVRHIQYAGGDDLSVSVEINDPNVTPGHFHTMREVQRLSINQVNVRDTTNITIINPDGGQISINIVNPKDNSLFQSSSFSTNSSASDVYNALLSYYRQTWSCFISVSRTMYDVDGNVTNNVMRSVKTVFSIALNRAISQASTNQMSCKKISTTSTVQITLPKNNQLSTPPLSGSFYIQCTNPDGTTNTTIDMFSSNSTSQIANQLTSTCPYLREKFEIWDNWNAYGYYDDGRDIFFRFIGLNYDVPQLEIFSSTTKPLSGNNLTLNSTTWIAYDPTHLFYEPVPFEFMYTAETQPQIIVSVDGVEAVCASLQCGYNYIQATAEITSFTYSSGLLTISGSGFVNQIRQITFSNLPCLNVQLFDSQTITCQVTAVSGLWLPVVVDTNGLIPVTTTNLILVPLTVTGATPNQNLNPYGGTQLQISGNNLPQSLTDGTQISIIFDDGTPCIVETTSSTLIKCVTEQFSSGIQSVTMNITINGETDTSQTLTISAGPAVVTSITPNSVSPVLKNILTLAVSNFTGTLDPNDLSVSLTSQSDPSIVRYINIIEVGNTNGNQYIKVKFGGSESGIYQVKVRSNQYGRFDTTGITIELIGKVTSYYPAFGSVNGGTFVTINGYHFSNDIQDNPVRIGYSDCMVQSSSETQITCITMPSMDQIDGTDDFLVFLKTYEQAVCDVNPCTFQWVKTGLAAVTSYTVNFDNALNDYVLTIFGTNFSANTTNTKVLIDNNEQKLLSASDSQLSVQIVNISSSFTRNINIFLPIGFPDGTEDLTFMTGINLTPQFLSLSPNVGSVAGSIITAYIKGVGQNTPGVQLLGQNNVVLCSKITIIDFGIVQCQTTQRVQALASISVQVNGTVYNCVGTGGECNYTTSTSSMPIVTSVSKQDDQTLVLIGDGFQVAGFDVKVIYAGVPATTVTVINNTYVTAQYQYGVPIASTAANPQLILQSSTNATAHWAQSTATLQNAIAVAQLDQPITCSFAGGCMISISQAGLLSNIVNDPVNNVINVCNAQCTPDINSSTAQQVQCKVPALATTYSIENYKISSESYLMGTPFSSKPQLTMTLFDGSHQNGWNDTTANCSFGTAFREGYVGVINEVKYFMTTFNRNDFVGKLLFQGSQDNITWTTIFTVGQEIHEGWNYYNFPAGQELVYRYFRYFGTATGSCQVGEITFRGYEAINNNDQTYSCQAQIVLNGTPLQSLTGSISYQGAMTPLLNSISPRFGSVVGGDLVTFTGQNFVNDTSLYTIIIDDEVCQVQNASPTSVSCITAKRPGLFEPSLVITINGVGNVATQGLIFRYCNYWSHTVTWGGEFAPIAGDMVYVPGGLHLLVDVDSTPVLSAVVIEGSLIFPPHNDPNHLRTFDAHYVLVRGGIFEAGTEQFPYTSKLQITMHSTRDSPELPIFGNKVIAMYNGVLDLQGVPRHPTWTMLETTSEIGSNTITLIESVDWNVGERIIVAPTGYYNTEAEEMTIVSVDRTNPGKPIITLDKPFEFRHYAAVETYGNDFIEMRAEVGLLTRNILYRGDPETSALNEYGAQIMVHSDGGENLIARIQYVEFFNVGQAFQLGRYPIHFHLIGAVHNSYIIGNAVHQSYNRACTIHGVHYLRIIDNVAYNIKGHTFFIEDAAETNNYLEHNLAVLTKRSWSLLNSDQSPACFWITHPTNIFRRNHCAGADNYGFWFDTKPNPTGPSFDPNQCPENSPLGEFTNNVAHSCGRYGLRLFHKLKPRKYPCQDIIDDPNNTTDPYWQNPVITAVFENFTSFKNQRNGAIALDMGAVTMKNFKVADNLIAGIEFELTNNLRDGYCQVNGALVIGRSGNADSLTNSTNSHGIIGPRTENFQVHNVKFYNFDVADKAALGSCSHCFAAPSTDSGARTVTFSNLYFDSSVKVKIRYQEPWREIFYDLDGSLTGLGPNTWTTPYWRHNDHPECTYIPDVYDGFICNSSVQVRRLVFYNYAPSYLTMMDMKVLQYEDRVISSMTNDSLKSYLLDTNNYSVAKFRPKTNPLNSWALPYVTGKKYKIHWQYGLDWTQIQMDLSPKWLPTDNSIYFVHNFSDVRASIDFLTGGDNIKNLTLLSNNANDLQTGANIVYNDSSVRMIHFLVNGKNNTRKQLLMKGNRCIGPCLAAITNVPIETNIRYWSNASSWETNKVPLAGEDVVIPSGQNFVFDLPESPIYNYIQINGRVTFLESEPTLHLRAKYIFVRAGELIIGSQADPFQGQARITLYGEQSSQSIVYTDAIEAGNKILANTGFVQMFGKPRQHRTRLLKTVNKGDNKITVEPGLGWQADESIGLAPTAIRWHEKDFAIIKSYDNATGVLTLDRQLDNYHWGQSTSTAADYSGVDMRGEVMLLTRNVRIVGNDSENWGCQFLTGDFIEGDGTFRQGNTIIDHVEIYNCSQYDTFKAAIRFDGATGAWSKVSNAAIHHGSGFGIEISGSANITIQNSTVFSHVKYGINLVSVNNVTIDGNWVIGVNSRHYVGVSMGDPMGGIIGCADEANDKCFGLKVINNIVAGVEKDAVDVVGYTMYPHECGDYKNIVFRNNTAHSIAGNGATIFKNDSSPSQDKCLEASYFTAYKCQGAGIVSNQATDQVIFSNMVLIDNGYSAIAMVGQEGTDQWAKLINIKFYGETQARDCDRQNQCLDWSGPGCLEKNAIMPSSFANHHKQGLIRASPKWPQWKIKADASFGGTSLYQNVQFINFQSGTTWCGMEQRLFRLNRFNADYYPMVKLTNTHFQNVDWDAFAYFFTPPEEWANVDDCGQFPCTGPNNVLLKFSGATYGGTVIPVRTQTSFQLISGVFESSGNFSNCQRVDKWNGYYCTNDNLAIVTFESKDFDNFTRILSPITVQGLNISTRNVLNTFMDHLWDGFYTSFKRLSRFSTLIQGGQNMYYQIIYKSTPPQNQAFSLRADYTSVIIRIKYPKPGMYIIKDQNGNTIKANDWDNTIQGPGLIKSKYCGENRYVGVQNILEFYLSPKCNISISIIDSIQSSVRLNWTLNEFYSSGGTTKFVDRIAASLGIKVANVKVVSVYQGSVFVDFHVVDDPSGTVSSMGGLDTVQNVLQQKISSNQVDLGAPILSATIQSNKATSNADITTVQPSPIVIIPGSNTQTSTQQVAVTPTSTSSTTSNPVATPIIKTPPSATTVVQPVQIITKNNTVVVVSSNEEQGGSNTVMIAVVCSIVGVIIIGAVIGFFIYKKYRSSLPTLDQTPKELDQSSKECGSGVIPDVTNEDFYDKQYHPKVEFGDIYSRGDPFNKAYQADEVDEEDYEQTDHQSPEPNNLTDIVDMCTNQKLSVLHEDLPIYNMKDDNSKQMHEMNLKRSVRNNNAEVDEEIGQINKVTPSFNE